GRDQPGRDGAGGLRPALQAASRRARGDRTGRGLEPRLPPHRPTAASGVAGLARRAVGGPPPVAANNSMRSSPTSPSHRSALGPSLSPLKDGEGKNGRCCFSLSALGGGEGWGEVGEAPRKPRSG